MSASAVVFAYHDVGVRCLAVLLAGGVDVRLVVTHEDNPAENIWFGSVRRLAEEHGIAVITPADPNVPEVVARVRDCRADFLFSFYYRHMLKAPLLQSVTRGAYNLHGSLLPKYRGRVPINWAVIRGESETGATLHLMNEKPDNGAIVGQRAVPILPDDTAHEVFGKVLVAAELVLVEQLPRLLDGTATLTPQNLAAGQYFGGRKPEDGRIDWSQPAQTVHNLVRGVTRPYPGAFSDTGAGRLVVWRTRVDTAPAAGRDAAPALLAEDGRLRARAGDGRRLIVLDAELAGRPLDAARLRAEHGGALALR
ncbi:formyltransferase [Solimonas soli]|uniref:formyltransferase n=1 Tax=Solimonas soli TaxID=413479 RepID=UPI0004835B8D|nr:formyltransferase [Solimonas soli]